MYIVPSFVNLVISAVAGNFLFTQLMQNLTIMYVASI
jgi:hypothetical protein